VIRETGMSPKLRAYPDVRAAVQAASGTGLTHPGWAPLTSARVTL
jgi:hypothetical protein